MPPLSSRIHRCGRLVLFTSLVLLSSEHARSAPGKSSAAICEATYKDAIEKEKTGRLIEAQGLVRQCAHPDCGLLLSRECATKFTQLYTDIPSIITLVTDESGAPRTEVELRIDGVPVVSRAEGTAVLVNPGLHELTFAVDGKIFRRQILLMIQGQRNRVISTVFREAPRAKSKSKHGSFDAEASAQRVSGLEPEETAHMSESERAPRQNPVESSRALETSSTSEKTRLGVKIALGGVGLVGLGGYGLLTYWGRKDNSALAQCAPYCPQSAVDHVHHMYLAADVSLGVGLAAVIADVWAIAAWRSTPGADSERAVKLDVGPTNSGAIAAVRRSF